MTTDSPFDFTLRPGLIFTTGKTTFLIQTIQHDEVILKNTSNHNTKTVKIVDIINAYAAGEITLILDQSGDTSADSNKTNDNEILSKLPLSDLSQAQIDHVLTVTRYVRKLRASGHTCLRKDSLAFQQEIDKLRKELGDKKEIKSAWLYKWSLKLDRANGDPRSVIPRYDQRGGGGKHRIDQRTAIAIDQAIQSQLSDKNSRLRTIDIQRDAEAILRTQDPKGILLSTNLSWCTVDRVVKNTVPSYTLCVHRKGEAYAKQKYRHWYPRDRAEHPLEVAETDDMDTSVFLVDERSGLPFGRGWMTSVIDQATRPITGYCLSEQARSVSSAINALVTAILPKDLSLPEYRNCNESLEFFGRPGVVVFDNALYNHANALELAAMEMGITIAWAKPKTPQEKSQIEGWHRIIKSELFSDLSGWRGDISQKEGLAQGVISANLGLREFKTIVSKWVTDVYSNKPCDDGLTPRQAWHAKMRNVTLRLPLDIHGLKIVACVPTTTKLRPEGVRFQGISYFSPMIQAMRKRYGYNAEIKLKYNPNDLAHIYVFEPELKNYFKVDSTDGDYASGLSLYQHKLIVKMRKDLKKTNPSIINLLIAREELKKLTQQLRFSKKLRERKIAIRTGDIPNHASNKNIMYETIVQTELETSVSEIDAIEYEYIEDEWNLPSGF